MICSLILLLITGALGVPSSSRIVGGHTAYDGLFPYQVSLKLEENHHCGGSIINTKTILSAAHCYTIYSATSFNVVVGTVKLSDTEASSYKVSAIKLHEYFSQQSALNDIATIRLADSIVYNSKVQPITLGTEFVGTNLYAVLSGWGHTHPGVVPDTLQYIDLLTMDNKQCSERYQYKIHDSQLCTFGWYGIGACHGDSGGPLVISGKQIGVVSFGKPPCGTGMPDVFTRLSYYLTWIQVNS